MPFYQLKHPVKDENGIELTSVNVRRIKMKDLRAVEKEQGGDLDHQAMLISRLTGMIPPVVDELDVEDILGISELIGDFQLPGGTGMPRR